MRAADATLDELRAKLGAVLDDLDADMAETQAKRAQTPRSMTRLRGQLDRDLESMAARFEATERELGELGPAAAPAPPLPAMTAEDWDAPTTTAAGKAAVIRRLGLPDHDHAAHPRAGRVAAAVRHRAGQHRLNHPGPKLPDATDL